MMNGIMWAFINIVGIAGLLFVMGSTVYVLDKILCRVWDYIEKRIKG